MKNTETNQSPTSKEPPKHTLELLRALHKDKDWPKIIDNSKKLMKRFPQYKPLLHSCASAYINSGRFRCAIKIYESLATLEPTNAAVYNNLGVLTKQEGNFEDALSYFKKALSIKKKFPEVHNNLGNLFSDQGYSETAVVHYQNAIDLKPHFIQAYLNLAVAYLNLGEIASANLKLKQAMALDPNNREIYWHLYGCSSTVHQAKSNLKQCLRCLQGDIEADLAYTFLDAFEGNNEACQKLAELTKTDTAHARSAKWAINLRPKPRIYFNRWDLFDFVISQSSRARPFYEYGVWRGVAFKYLMKFFEKGYGFDTFTGLPQSWHQEKKGSYSSNGLVPDIDGGEFIVGKFENTLPKFFKKTRPIASVINFDADLYSSTICALNYSKNIIDEDTILIFDEFLMNHNWEEDEFKALEEFCSENDMTYEVLAVSFSSKQVAVKLIAS